MKYAEDIGSNSKAAIDKGVNEKSIREWKQQKNISSANLKQYSDIIDVFNTDFDEDFATFE